MTLLASKIKVKQDILSLYDLLDDQRAILNNARIAVIEEKRLFKDAINVVYAVLVNFTTPINRKINALLLLKRLFQTAHPEVIQEARRVIPVLTDIAISAKREVEPGSLYFVLKELRPVDETDNGRKYVRFAAEILKQWGEYMVDIKEEASIYATSVKKTEAKGVVFPSYFLHFTIKDYLEFMGNFMRGKRRDFQFKDKMEVFLFLTQNSSYTKNFPLYRENISGYAAVLVQGVYSVLINHSIPVESKLHCLRALQDLYQEGNFMFCDRVDEIITPCFDYLVDLFAEKQVPLERYFEIVERRLGVDPKQSAEYVLTILQLIKQWEKYNSNTHNPFTASSTKIDKKNLLTGSFKSLFQPSDSSKYKENSAIGRHRQPEYVIPPNYSPTPESEVRYKQQIRIYQKRLEDQAWMEESYKKEILELKNKLKKEQSPTNYQDGKIPLTTSAIQPPNPNPNPISSNPTNEPSHNQSLNKPTNSSKNIQQKDNQLLDKVSKPRYNSRQPFVNQRSTSTFTPQKLSKMENSHSHNYKYNEDYVHKDLFDIKQIYKLSDAVRYKEMKQSRIGRSGIS